MNGWLLLFSATGAALAGWGVVAVLAQMVASWREHRR